MIYVCGDPHGHYEKYRAMLDAISFRSTYTLYVLGDMIDRGSEGCKILRDMMGRPNVLPILRHVFALADRGGYRSKSCISGERPDCHTEQLARQRWRPNPARTETASSGGAGRIAGLHPGDGSICPRRTASSGGAPRSPSTVAAALEENWGVCAWIPWKNIMYSG